MIAKRAIQFARDILSVSIQLNEEFCRILGVKHKMTAAYHPQTNGLDERTNQNIKRY